MSNKPYNPHQKKEVRKPYLYKTGAKYTGEWLGGFRHGFGTMEWPDGASYQGQWLQGKAEGYGRFLHVNGD